MVLPGQSRGQSSLSNWDLLSGGNEVHSRDLLEEKKNKLFRGCESSWGEESCWEKTTITNQPVWPWWEVLLCKRKLAQGPPLQIVSRLFAPWVSSAHRPRFALGELQPQRRLWMTRWCHLSLSSMTESKKRQMRKKQPPGCSTQRSTVPVWVLQSLQCSLQS